MQLKMPVGSDSKAQMALVARSKIWKEDGSIRLAFGNNKFQAFSYTGTDAKLRPPTEPTMVLGYLDPPFQEFSFLGLQFKGPFKDLDGTLAYRNGCLDTSCPKDYIPGACILHEFGHALGLLHEHQNFVNDNKVIQFHPMDLMQKCLISSCTINNPCYKTSYDKNVTMSYNALKENMIRDCGSSDCISNQWSEETIRINILDNVTDITQFDASDIDYDSIMMYPLPSCLVKNGLSLKKNYKYSKTDLEYLKKWYPTNKSITLRVHFIESEPKWKIYFVMKCISENLSPFIGINFLFIDKMGNTLYNTDNFSYETEEPLSSVTKAPADEPDYEGMKGVNKTSTENVETDLPFYEQERLKESGSLEQEGGWKGKTGTGTVETGPSFYEQERLKRESAGSSSTSVGPYKPVQVSYSTSITGGLTKILGSNISVSGGRSIIESGTIRGTVEKVNDQYIIKNATIQNGTIRTEGSTIKVNGTSALLTTGNVSSGQGLVERMGNVHNQSKKERFSNQKLKQLWEANNRETVPRPQGALANDPWGLTEDEINNLDHYYLVAFNGY